MKERRFCKNITGKYGPEGLDNSKNTDKNGLRTISNMNEKRLGKILCMDKKGLRKNIRYGSERVRQFEIKY